MLYLLLSVLCSVTVGVLFKIFRKESDYNPVMIISSNYLVAGTLSGCLFADSIALLDKNSPWLLYTALGILLPSVFWILAKSINNAGIAKTDVAQRLSLFLTLFAATFLFGEKFSSNKILSILLALCAMTLLLRKGPTDKKNSIYYLGLVFFGYGSIDILFKQLAKTTQIPFGASMFIIFCIAFAISLSTLIKIKNYSTSNLYRGAIVGIFNFGNIYFYLQAHKAFAQNPSTVFLAMNMGVITLGCLIGTTFFKEKLLPSHLIGITLAIASILLLFLF